MNRTIRWRNCCCFYYENELEKKRHVNVSSWQANFILVQDLQKPFEDLSFGLSLHTYILLFYLLLLEMLTFLFLPESIWWKSFPLSVIENYKYAFEQNYNPWQRRVNLKANPPVNQQTCCSNRSNLSNKFHDWKVLLL